MEKNRYLTVTVDVEEWFHSNWFNVDHIINKYYDGNIPETDVVESIQKILSLFKRIDIRATFFVLGETAVKYPNIIDIIKEENHEIACHGFNHDLDNKNVVEFRKDIRKFKNRVYGNVVGFRFPNFNFSRTNLTVLSEEGFKYDSSVVPCLPIPHWYGNLTMPIHPYYYNIDDNFLIKEYPIAVSPIIRLPGGGGWFLRNLGFLWAKIIVQSLLLQSTHAIIYIHPWEVSNNNPNFEEIPNHVFRNCGKNTMYKLEKIIKHFKKSVSIIALEESYE
mgnify:CR=1 FL=1